MSDLAVKPTGFDDRYRQWITRVSRSARLRQKVNLEWRALVEAFPEETAWLAEHGYPYDFSVVRGFVLQEVEHAVHFKLRFCG